MITDKRELAIMDIASILDHPSVYMGGPSHGNRRNADRILKYLEKEGVVNFAVPADLNDETDPARIISIILGGGTVSQYSTAVTILDGIKAAGLMIVRRPTSEQRT